MRASGEATTPSAERQHEILLRGTEEVLPEGELLSRLRASVAGRRPLRVKQGFDPTAPDIHLGHTVGLRKLRQFQDLGHQIVLIVGDYTAMVGDPSGVKTTRPQLAREQVEANAATYLEQFFRVLERDPAPPRLPVEVHRNGDWFSRMSFLDVTKLLSQYTVARMLERDDFSARFEANRPIGLHEFIYPLMVAYDSVAIRADVELGATEQKFNLIAGRTLQEIHGQPQQIVMTLPVLPGLDGKQRMSKSLGNYVGVTDAPNEMFGKIMSLPDAVLELYWRLVTDADDDELARVRDELADGATNPMVVKKRLGHRIVRMYHGEPAAERAQHDFETQFSRGGVPEDLPEFDRASVDAARAGAPRATLVECVVASGFAPSKSAARKLVQQGAVSVDGERMQAHDAELDLARPFVLRVGRRMARYRPS